MIKTYKYAVTGSDKDGVLLFLGFAETLKEANALAQDAQREGYRHVAIIDASGQIQSRYRTSPFKQPVSSLFGSTPPEAP